MTTSVVHRGESLAVLQALDSGSIDCAVTSPPYYMLRNYHGHPDEIGNEATAAEYVERLVKMFGELHRVLADDGTFWLNVGDSYSTGRAGHPSAKSLRGIPWRIALALQDWGWIIRNAIVWNKTNARPESVPDRLSTRHEMIYLLVKQPRYWFNLDAIRVPHSPVSVARRGRADLRTKVGWDAAYVGSPPRGLSRRTTTAPVVGANPGDIWNMANRHAPPGHFAVFPPELPRRCILAGCKPDGVVLDPFHGSGTTGDVAQELGHSYIGIDLNPA